MLDESFEERSCDVVRQISNKMERPGREFDLQRIAFDDLHICRHRTAKRGNQISIDFNCNHLPRGCRQLASQRTRSRTNLDDSVFRCDAGELNDSLQDRSIG